MSGTRWRHSRSSNPARSTFGTVQLKKSSKVGTFSARWADRARFSWDLRRSSHLAPILLHLAIGRPTLFAMALTKGDPNEA